MEKIFIEISDSYINDDMINSYLEDGWNIKSLKTEAIKQNGVGKFLVVVVIEKK